MGKGKIIQWVIVILLIANIALTSAFWCRSSCDVPSRNHPGGGPPRLEKILEFDSTQITTFEVLREEHQLGMRTHLDSIHSLRETMHSRLSGAWLKSASVDSHAIEIGRHYAAIEMVTYNHFKDLRALCNEKQIPQLELWLKEILDRNGPPLGSPPPPPNGHGGPHGNPPPPPPNF